MNDRRLKSNVTAVISMLHERAEVNSATRRFRGEAVLGWTLARLRAARGLGTMAVLCWEDQLEEVRAIAEEEGAHVLAKGPRQETGNIQAIAAAQRWADGWRGGLLNTCDFDRGFHAQWIEEIMRHLEASAAILVDPSSALVDPRLIDALIDRASEHPKLEMIFAPAAPGLCGVLLRPAMLQRLATTRLHPGKLLHYLPDAPAHDPCSGEGCLPIPTPVARTLHRFKLDSQREIDRVSRATISLNGQLIGSVAEELVARMTASRRQEDLPREVVLEVNTRRHTRAIYRPAASAISTRPDMTGELAGKIFEQLTTADDLRLTIAGAGDPLINEHLEEILEAARRHNISAIHIETDLVGVPPERIELLARSGVDVLSVHLPAASGAMYREMMGVDAFAEALGNVRQFIELRGRLGRATPILAPTFVKCRQNLGEMEAWYDQWLRAVSAAVIVAPSSHGGLIPDCSVAGMSASAGRGGAWRDAKMHILSDGRVVADGDDVLGRQCVGNISDRPLGEIWRSIEKERS